MDAPKLVALEYWAWRRKQHDELSDCIFECRLIADMYDIPFEPELATWMTLVDVLALVWEVLPVHEGMRR